MSLVAILAVLILVGAILYFVSTLPIDGTIQRIIYGVVCLFVVVWLLQSLGVMPALGSVRVR